MWTPPEAQPEVVVGRAKDCVTVDGRLRRSLRRRDRSTVAHA